VLVLAAASWAAGSVSSRQLDLPRSPLLATAMEMVTGGALLLVLGAATGECGRLDPAAVTPASAAAVLYLVVFGSLVGFSAFIWLLRVTTPAIATTYAYVNPLVALALGWAFLGESIPPRVAAGAAVILGAVALISRSAPPAGNPAGQPASTSSGPSSG
ncbi:MAG: EamA family transporter, partial [Candidatus Brocadiae bacterium]|nr:EamA family transporter [Candidatus Brocadiia bacterium]